MKNVFIKRLIGGFIFLALTSLAVGGNLKTTTPATNPDPDRSKEYKWLERHEQVKKENLKKPELIFVGDSITHYFGGSPKARFVRGGDIWEKYYGHRNAVNMGFGWDQTQHVLWRFEHGELDGISPKLAVVMIGVNNVLRNCSAEDTAKGIEAICNTLKKKLPKTQVLLVGILPYSKNPTDKGRIRLQEVNKIIAKLGKEDRITFIDIGDKFLSEDGTISKEIMPDTLHPNAKGYTIFAKAIEPEVSRLLKDKEIK
jgi:beta-glucosidase